MIRFGKINVVINPDKPSVPNAQNETLKGILREYNAGKNKIILSNKFIISEISEYETFEKHYHDFQTILISIYKKQRITSARTGIRYINIYGVESVKLRKNMFSPEISATFSAKEHISDNGSRLIRAMNLNEYQVGNMLLNFRFGMFNPDYPNPLNKESFALDYDCFTTEPIETMDDVLRTIEEGHNAIQELFEASITDSMRKVLDRE